MEQSANGRTPSSWPTSPASIPTTNATAANENASSGTSTSPGNCLQCGTRVQWERSRSPKDANQNGKRDNLVRNLRCAQPVAISGDSQR
jgi:hypothetical protein